MANTTNQGWAKPTVGGSADTWGSTINAALDSIDTLVGGVSATEIAKLDGLTSSTAELNKLTGVTSTPAELNKLTGVTATPAELNLVAGLTASTAELDHVTGVTSAIQTQINDKQSVDATLTALAGLATGADKVPYSTGVDTFGQLDFKDEDDMASDSATAVPSQQSVKAYVDAAPRGLDFQTAVATTSGTFVDFDSIPSTATEVNIYWVGYKGTGRPLVRLKVGGVALDTGYTASAGTSGNEQGETTGFSLNFDLVQRIYNGMMTLHRISSGTWVESHSVGTGADSNGGGSKTGVGTVDGGIRCIHSG